MCIGDRPKSDDKILSEGEEIGQIIAASTHTESGKPICFGVIKTSKLDQELALQNSTKLSILSKQN